MKNLFTYFERISATLVIGVLFSFGISSVLATYTPSEAPGDPYELITPTFNALYIGNGAIVDPSADDLYVEGVTTSVGGVDTDYINGISGGDIDVSTGLKATTFGDIYYKNSTSTATCSSSSSSSSGYCPSYVAGATYYYSKGASCDAGDYLIGCTGSVVTSTSAVLKGTYVYKISTIYACRASASTSSVSSTATCFSPDDSQGENTSDI